MIKTVPSSVKSFNEMNIQDLLDMKIKVLAKYFASRDIEEDEDFEDPVAGSSQSVAGEIAGIDRTVRKKRTALRERARELR